MKAEKEIPGWEGRIACRRREKERERDKGVVRGAEGQDIFNRKGAWVAMMIKLPEALRAKGMPGGD